MILIDTSVWIFALRKKPNESIKNKVDKYLSDGVVAITPPIKFELLCGLKNKKDLERMALRFDALPSFKIKNLTWNIATDLAFGLRRKGITIPYFDLLISAVALENGVPLVHADSHFDTVSKHTALKVDSCLYLI